MSDSSMSLEGETREGSDFDYEPPRTSRRRSAGAREGQSQPRSRGRGGARVRVRGPLNNLSQDDLTRVQNLREQRISSDRARIQNMTLGQCQELLLPCLDREPSLIFDILDTSASLHAAHPQPPFAEAVHPQPVQPQPLNWCVCSHCREMPTLIERKCCGQQPQQCVSFMPHMDLFILEDGVLRLARRIWNDMRAGVDAQDIGESNKQFRYAAYRQFVVWRYGVLGPGQRVVIPSCCVWRIRDRFPDPYGNYVGFIPSTV